MQLRMTLTRMIVPALVCTLAVGSPAQGQCEVQEFQGSDTSSVDNFGSSVDIDGKTMVAGAINHGNTGGGIDGAGAAYVYEFDGSLWVEVAMLASSDLEVDDEFGGRVAICGNTIVVGAGQHGPGAVYVFEKPASGWATMTETAKLTGTDSTGIDTFGSSLAIDGSTIVVGALNHNSDQGALYIYELAGDVWASATETAKLAASDAVNGDRLGRTVAIDRNVIVAGADQNGAGGPGAAYVYVRAAGGWIAMTESAKLTASDGASGDRFGFGLDIRGNVIVVGAFLDDTIGGTDAGSAYVFEKPAGGWGTMTETQSITASDGGSFDNLGLALTILHDDTFFVGTQAHRFNATIPGAVYRFQRTGAGWFQTMKIVQSDGVVGDQFGTSLAVSGDFLIVGANTDDAAGTNAGSVYFFTGVTGIAIACPPPPCLVGDINCDGVIDLIDLELCRVLVGACIGDVNFDGHVGIEDFLIILAQWGCGL